MADTKYIAVKNFYGPNGMKRKGKEAVYNAKHVKKNLIVTEDEWKKMQSEQKKASKIAANAKTSALSTLASKEVQAVSKILTSQIEVIDTLTDNVEVAFTEVDKQLEEQIAVNAELIKTIGNATKLIDTLTDNVEVAFTEVDKQLEEQIAVNAELIKTIGNATKLIDGLVEDVNRLKATTVVTPEETKVVTPEETKPVTRTRRAQA